MKQMMLVERITAPGGMLALLLVVACGTRGTRDLGQDATLNEDAASDSSTDAVADAQPDQAVVDMSCDGGPLDADLNWGMMACCGGTLCRGLCSDAGVCMCGNVPGGCAPLYCCVSDQICRDYCGAGQ